MKNLRVAFLDHFGSPDVYDTDVVDVLQGTENEYFSIKAPIVRCLNKS